MAKCIDITDKLSFDKNPALIIKGRKFVVNADAGTMHLPSLRSRCVWLRIFWLWRR